MQTISFEPFNAMYSSSVLFDGTRDWKTHKTRRHKWNEKGSRKIKRVPNKSKHYELIRRNLVYVYIWQQPNSRHSPTIWQIKMVIDGNNEKKKHHKILWFHLNRQTLIHNKQEIEDETGSRLFESAEHIYAHTHAHICVVE